MKKGYGSSEPIDEENDYEMDESDLVSHHYVHNSTWRTKLTLFIVVTVVVIFLVAGSTNKLSMTFLSFFDESSARGVTIIASSTKTSNVDVAVADDEPRSTTVGGDNFTSSTFTVVDEATTVEKNSFRFTLVRSGYDPISYFSTSASEFLNYKVLQGYSAVLEPYANMNLYLLDGTDLNARYDYTVCKLNSEVEECYEGAATYDGGAADVSVSVACTPYDEYSVSVSEIDLDTGSEVATGYINALCLYVRRDIEFLSETDLSNTMDAMYKLWDLTDDEGQELYGSDFHRYRTILHHTKNSDDDTSCFSVLSISSRHISSMLRCRTAITSMRVWASCHNTSNFRTGLKSLCSRSIQAYLCHIGEKLCVYIFSCFQLMTLMLLFLHH